MPLDSARGRRRSFLVALLLPLLITAATLAAVVRNRSGGREPITLSEREVSLTLRDDDNTAATLWLSWQPSIGARGGGPSGVELRRPPERTVPRRAFVALELDGPAFRALPTGPTGDLGFRPSRLVVVDVDRDAEVLARRYPNGRTHLITEATVQVPPDGTYSTSWVVSLNPQRIYVPREWVSELPRPLRNPGFPEPPPPFEVDVRYGLNYEPWVVAVRRR